MKALWKVLILKTFSLFEPEYSPCEQQVTWTVVDLLLQHLERARLYLRRAAMLGRVALLFRLQQRLLRGRQAAGSGRFGRRWDGADGRRLPRRRRRERHRFNVMLDRTRASQGRSMRGGRWRRRREIVGTMRGRSVNVGITWSEKQQNTKSLVYSICVKM